MPRRGRGGARALGRRALPVVVPMLLAAAGMCALRVAGSTVQPANGSARLVDPSFDPSAVVAEPAGRVVPAGHERAWTGAHGLLADPVPLFHAHRLLDLPRGSDPRDPLLGGARPVVARAPPPTSVG